MNFGERGEMVSLANRRLGTVRNKFPKVTRLDPDDLQVIFMVAHEPSRYHEFAVASNRAFDITRQVALKRMLRPITNFSARLL
jgi:formate dehydrogenase iron-sulfur subunit